LATQEEILADRALVILIPTQTNGVWRVHGATVVDSIAEQQAMRNMNVFLTYSEHLTLDHGKAAVVVLMRKRVEKELHEQRFNLCRA
jgi:hypothetical protein